MQPTELFPAASAHPRGMRRKVAVVMVLSIVVVAAGLAYVGVSQVLATGDRPSAAPPREGTTVVEGADRLPSATAQDWVTYADHVVVVTPAAESDLGPSQGEIALGEGSVLRSIDLRVDEVVWSSPVPAAPAPQSFTWTGFGWTFHDGVKNRSEMVPAGQPRVEIGHAYVMAIDWEPDLCSGDARLGRWLGLGSDSTLPYDGQRIGVGEYEGAERDLAQAEEEAERLGTVYERAGSAVPLSVSLVGDKADALHEVLARQEPAVPEQFGPEQATCEE